METGEEVVQSLSDPLPPLPLTTDDSESVTRPTSLSLQITLD